MSAHTSFYQRCFQIAIAAVLVYAVLETLLPLRGVLGWAVVLAFILHPLHERLARRLKGRAWLSAGILTVLTPFLVLAPLGLLGVVFAGQVARLIGHLRRASTEFSWPQVLERLSHYPLVGHAVSWVRANADISAGQIQGWVTDGLQTVLKAAASMGGSLALGVFGALVGFFIMLFVLFFFLRDGRTIIEHLTRLVPVEHGRRASLIEYLANVTRAVVFGSVTTAVIDGVIVGCGFALAGLPSPVVFGALAAIAAFLPAGAAIVLIPAIAFVAIEGRWGAALFLAAWTAGMWIVENVMRPLLTAHHAEVSTLAIFVGALGGVAAFGLLGLLIGPVLLSFVVALVRFAQVRPPAGA